MARKPKDELPRLPRGMGTYTWWNEAHTMIQYRKMVGEEPNRKRVAVYGETVSECNAKMAKLEQKYKSGCCEKASKDPHNASLTLKEAVREWMVQFKEPVLKGRAYDTLESTYRCHLEPADFAAKQVEQVTDTDIQKWLVSISEKRSKSTVNKAQSLINMFFNFYHVRDMQNNPMLTVSKPPKDHEIKFTDEGLPLDPDMEYEVMEDDEILRFEEEALRKPSPGKPGSKYGNYLIFILWSFMRFGESIALQWKDVNFEKKTVNVYKGYNLIRNRSGNGNRYKWEMQTAKTSSGRRYFYLPDNAVDALVRFRDLKGCYVGDDDFIICTENGTPVQNSYANDVLKSVLKRAGIDKHITLHGLRHSGISYCRRHGMDPDVIAHMAGHSSREITDRVYYSLTDDQLSSEIGKINSTIQNQGL